MRNLRIGSSVGGGVLAAHPMHFYSAGHRGRLGTDVPCSPGHSAPCARTARHMHQHVVSLKDKAKALSLKQKA
jgi:hypothetical protein